MRLYLDIDGVITGNSTVLNLNVVEFGGAMIEYDPVMLRKLLEPFDDIVWATSWLLHPAALAELEEYFDFYFDRIKLDSETYVTSSPLQTCGKLEAVREHYLANPAPFLWIDDHIRDRDRGWARSVGGHVLVPNYDRGGMYQPGMVDRALDIAVQDHV